MTSTILNIRPVSSGLAALLLALSGAPASAQCSSTKITASDAAAFDGFAGDIVMDTTAGGTLAIIGAPSDDTPEGSAAGSVYVFSRSGNSWVQTSHFFPLDLNTDAGFGHVLGYDDPYLIVGTPGADGSGVTNMGAFYMYERSGSTWVPKGRYVSGLATDFAHTGWSVDVTTANGGRAIVGIPDLDIDGNSQQSGDQNPLTGAAAIYERLADGTWGPVISFTDYNTLGGGANQHLGQAVAIGGDVAVVAAPNGAAPGKPSLSGFVKLIRRGLGGSWTVVGPSRLAPDDAQIADLFGTAVDTDGTYVAVSAINHDSTAEQTPKFGAKEGAGCVYVYRWNSGTSQFDVDGQLFADDAVTFTQLGATVRISGGRVFASSYSQRKVYCFRRISAGHWTQEYAITDPEPASGTGFAASFAVAGGAVMVGDPEDDRDGFINMGAAYAFTIDNADAGNDSCDGAKVVAAGNHTGCTTAATSDGATNCAMTINQSPDVWYSWTPGCSGNVIIDTIGSSYDTVLSVHSACPEPGDTHSIVCNDDASAPYAPDSLVTFNYTAGTTYLIRVSGFNGAAGNYVLRINDYLSPSNDTCATAQTVGLGAHDFKTCKATTNTLSGTGCTSVDMVNDLYFRCVAPANGTMTATTCGSAFDTVLQAFNASICPFINSAAIACNDDSGAACAGNPYASRVTFNVTAGAAYYLRVGGYANSTFGSVGDGVLTLSFASNCPCDWNQSGVLSVQDIFDFLASYFSGSGDFNQSGATTVQDIFDFLACYFAACP